MTAVRVLFLHSNTEDYLAQGLLHGLREVLGAGCVDVPRFDVLYRDLPAARRATLRGRGFTMYCLLDDRPELPAARAAWDDRLADFDLVVIANVWRQWRQLLDPRLHAVWKKLVLVDSEDAPAFFPYAGHLLRTPRAYLTGVTARPYFKREWVGGGSDYGAFARWLPGPLRRRLPSPRRARPIGFAIPAEKLCDFARPEKAQDFPRHVVDPELAAAGGAFFSAVGSDRYVFDTEADYYADLRRSRFGVTTKRAGWDCLRHYELAANGCVPCFRDLDRKPPTCAPHGLTAANSITYHSAGGLKARLAALSPGEYADLAAGTAAWARANTTAERAREFLTAAAR